MAGQDRVARPPRSNVPQSCRKSSWLLAVGCTEGGRRGGASGAKFFRINKLELPEECLTGFDSSCQICFRGYIFASIKKVAVESLS
jgi:hypothetical protein